jgi:integrase
MRITAAPRQRSEVQGLISGLVTGSAGRKPLAPGYVVLIYRWVSTIFRAAVEDQVIPRSLCRQINVPTVEKPKVQPLPFEVVEQLRDNINEPYRALIVLGAGTGVRISEAFGLTNDRIERLRRTVTIDRQLVTVKDGNAVFRPVKDKLNRPRTIPLPQVVIDALDVQEGLGRHCTPLGIPAGEGFHQLRHCYASLLIRAGESVKVVQDRLGPHLDTDDPGCLQPPMARG